MTFHAQPVDPASQVEMALDIMPALSAGERDSQRLDLVLNGTALGEWRVAEEAPLQVLIPAAVWNGRPEAVLLWNFPDGLSQAAMGRSSDPRPIAFGIRRIDFHNPAP